LKNRGNENNYDRKIIYGKRANYTYGDKMVDQRFNDNNSYNGNNMNRLNNINSVYNRNNTNRTLSNSTKDIRKEDSEKDNGKDRDSKVNKKTMKNVRNTNTSDDRKESTNSTNTNKQKDTDKSTKSNLPPNPRKQTKSFFEEPLIPLDENRENKNIQSNDNQDHLEYSSQGEESLFQEENKSNSNNQNRKLFIEKSLNITKKSLPNNIKNSNINTNINKNTNSNQNQRVENKDSLFQDQNFLNIGLVTNNQNSQNSVENINMNYPAVEVETEVFQSQVLKNNLRENGEFSKEQECDSR